MFDIKTLFKKEVKDILNESKKLEEALKLNRDKIDLLLQGNKTKLLKKELKRLIDLKIYAYNSIYYTNEEKIGEINRALNDLIEHLWD